MEKGEKRETFQRPAERDPFALELQRKNQTNEKQERPTLPGESGVAPRGIGPIELEQRPHPERARQNKRGREQSHPLVREGSRDPAIKKPELPGLREGADRPRPRFLLFRRAKREGDKEKKKKPVPDESRQCLGIGEAQPLPGQFRQPGAKKRRRRQPVRSPNDRGGEQDSGEKKSHEKDRGRIPEFDAPDENKKKDKRRERAAGREREQARTPGRGRNRRGVKEREEHDGGERSEDRRVLVQRERSIPPRARKRAHRRRAQSRDGRDRSPGARAGRRPPKKQSQRKKAEVGRALESPRTKRKKRGR